MRRLPPLLLVAAIAVTGCGTERPGVTPRADASYSPAPTQTADPTPTPTTLTTSQPSPAAALDGPLATFPLALGFAETNGDDGSPVVVTSEPATRAFRECGQVVWDPRDGSTALIGVEFRGEAEWSRGRTLVLYPSTEAASAAVDTVADQITSCPRDGGDDYGWTEHTGIDYEVGDQSFGWIDRYGTTELNGFDTGLTIYHAVRVDRAVLLTYEYDEGNGDEQTRLAAFARAAKEDQPVVDAMQERSDDTTAVALTPGGAAPFTLGMSVDDARRAADDVRIDDSTFCPQLSWTDRAGVHVHGAFSPGIGLAYLSIDGGGTIDGVAVGGTLGDLRAAYPNLEHQDNGLWTSDRGQTGYAFEVNQARVIDWMLVTVDQQQCAG